MKKSPHNEQARGQAVIEYAGALVICMVIVSVALITLPEGAYEFLEDTQSTILEFFVGEVEAIG